MLKIKKGLETDTMMHTVFLFFPLLPIETEPFGGRDAGRS
jgi:hypothetical protein